MEIESQTDSLGVSANFLLKRKRGRPRKYPKLDPNLGNCISAPRHQNLNHQGQHTPPGQEAYHNIPIRRTGTSIGEPVVGVVEAAFDAGFLLSAKVGNSGAMMRGIVLKPGHFIPVSDKNDVAPNLRMKNRKSVRNPKVKYGHAEGFGSRYHECRSASSFLEEKNTDQVPRLSIGGLADRIPDRSTQHIIPSGYLVPILLQPAKLPQNADKRAIGVEPTSSESKLVKKISDGTHISSPPLSNNIQYTQFQMLAGVKERVSIPAQATPGRQAEEKAGPVEVDASSSTRFGVNA